MEQHTNGALRAATLLLRTFPPAATVDESTLIQAAVDIDRATYLPDLINALEDLVEAHEALLSPPPGARTKRIRALLAKAKAPLAVR
jgi:hypothetical protein